MSDTTLEVARVTTILDYLERYHYASRNHVALLLLWHTGYRVGVLRGVDLKDLDLDGTRTNGKGPALKFNHRPETDTPLKNAEKGERWNSLSDFVAHVVQEYIDGPRIDKTDDHGRKPFISTQRGRASVSTIRDLMYCVIRPCWYGEECPHDPDPDECEATYYLKACKCPSSRSPHDVRSGRVTAYRLNNVPREVVGDRLNASAQILDKHYDRRSGRQKAEQRRKYLTE